jgi:hypothetical protein
MTDPRVYAAPNPAAERRAAVAPPAGASDGALWVAVLAPPLAWSLDALTSVAIHHDYCAALLGRTFRPWGGVGALLVAVGVVALLASLGAGALAWRARGAVGVDTGQGDTDVDRRRFMARAGLVTCALFSYGILLRTITLAFLSPARCGS